MKLLNDGYGTDKKIPSILMASASFSDIIAIELFGIFTQLETNKVDGKATTFMGTFFLTLILVFSGLIIGLAFGFALGFGLKKLKDHHILKCTGIVLVLGAFIAIVEKFHYYEALFIATLTMWYVLHQIWGDDKPRKDLMKLLKLSKPFLFGTIGAAIKFEDIEVSLIPLALLVIFSALAVRWVVTYLWVWNKKYNFGERLVFVVGWTPKATVQAVLGGFVYDWANSLDDSNPDKDDYYRYGNKILTSSVIAILITAPLGAILIENFGRKFLHKSEPGEDEVKPDQINNIAAVLPEPENSNAKQDRKEDSSTNKKSTSSEDEESKKENQLPDINAHRTNITNPHNFENVDAPEDEENSESDNSEIRGTQISQMPLSDNEVVETQNRMFGV